MPHPHEDRLLAILPGPTAELVKRAITDESEDHWRDAFTSVDFPCGTILPLPSELSVPQRALAEIHAHRPCGEIHGLPPTPESRRRWLGLDPGGALEAPVTFTADGQQRTAPLWRALQESVRTDSPALSEQVSASASILGALPFERRLAAVGEMYAQRSDGVFPYLLDGEALVLHESAGIMRELSDRSGHWAAQMADDLVARAAQEIERRSSPTTIEQVCATFGRIRWVVFVALARASVSIAPRWEPLLPVSRAPTEPYSGWTRECLRAIPSARRGEALAKAIAPLFPTEAFKVVIDLLAEVPSVEVLDAVLPRVDQLRVPTRIALKALAERASAAPELVARIDAVVASMPAIPRLACRATYSASGPDRLTPLQLEQLGDACSRWDGLPLSLAERFVLNDEGSLAGGELEICEVVDLEGGPGFVAYMLGGDSGTIFEAGTTVPVAEIVQWSIEAPSRALREALELALHGRPPPTPL